MNLRDLFNDVDEALVIARAVFEDKTKNEEIDGWITKYYAQLTRLKEIQTHKSGIMIYLGTLLSDKNAIEGDISGIEYSDIKNGEEELYAIEYLDEEDYASLFVPQHSIDTYGKEVVAAECLREYGWNNHDESIICPNEVRESVFEALTTMESGLFKADKKYHDCCIQEFVDFYEGKYE